MRKGGYLLAVLVAVAAASALAMAPAWSAGPEFLDQRPILFDLDHPDQFDGPWRVDVVNATPDQTSITLQVVGIPQLAVSPASARAVPAGGVATFRLSFGSRPSAPSVGYVVATTDTGTTARREVRVVYGRRTGPVPAIDLRGRRLAPLLRRVDVESVKSARLAPTGNSPVAAPLTGPAGDEGEAVVDTDGEVSVHGVGNAGRYAGTLALGEGREAGVVVKVRDSVLWPTLVLIAGLYLVRLVEDFSKVALPRHRIQNRLTGMRDALRTRQAQSPGPSVTRQDASSPPLVFDLVIDDALRDVATADGADGLAAWQEGKPKLSGVEAVREQCLNVLDAYADRAATLARVEAALEALGITARRVRLLDDLRDDLRPRPIAAKDALEQYAQRLTALQSPLQTWEALTEDLAGVPADERMALVRSAATLADLAAAASQAAEAAPLAAEALDIEPAAPTQTTSPESTAGPPARSSGRRGMAVVGAVATLVVLALGAVLVVDDSDEVTSPIEPSTTEAPVPSTPPFTGLVPRPPALGGPRPEVASPLAPTTLAPLAPSPDPGIDPSGLERAWWEVAVPALALLLGWAAARQVRALWRRFRRSRPKAAERDEEWAFGLLGSALVVLTGLSILYFPDDTFGTLGDYVKVLLWGSAVGEGVQLARRLTPLRGV